ncbi:unnamed protein product [Chrysoparadoxa australica]
MRLPKRGAVLGLGLSLLSRQAAAFCSPSMSAVGASNTEEKAIQLASHQASLSTQPPGYVAGTSLVEVPSMIESDYLEATPMKFREPETKFYEDWAQALAFKIKPLGRIKPCTVLDLDVTGGLPLATTSFRAPLSLTAVCAVLLNAAHDPRIHSIVMKVGDLPASTASLQEVRRHMDYFKGSGKKLYGFSARTLTLNQLYILGGATESYSVPDAYTDLTGFSFASDFIRGVLDKIGIEPQVCET